MGWNSMFSVARVSAVSDSGQSFYVTFLESSEGDREGQPIMSMDTNTEYEMITMDYIYRATINSIIRFVYYV